MIRANSLGFVHVCFSRNALRPFTINLTVGPKTLSLFFDDHEPGPQLTFAIHRPAAKQVHLLSFTRSGNFRRRDINNIGKNTTRRTTTKYC